MGTTQKKKATTKNRKSGQTTNLSELKEKYADALEVLRQIDRLPMESYHLNKFKEKWRGEL